MSKASKIEKATANLAILKNRIGQGLMTKAALYHSTILSTVSPTYAQEIQTGAYGNGLDGVLSWRKRWYKNPSEIPSRSS